MSDMAAPPVPPASVLGEAVERVRRQIRRKGVFATVRAITETVLQPVIRRRGRLVFDTPTDPLRKPSTWCEREKLLIFGPDEIRHLQADLRSALRPECHWDDFQDIRNGNRLFVVTYNDQLLYRSYACTVERPGLRKAVFFGELAGMPEIRGAETARYVRLAAADRGILKGLHTRVLNEQIRLLGTLGYERVVLYITAENTLSIRGAEAAGFRLYRKLTDWVLFTAIIVQKIEERGHVRWRMFWQRARR